ncbi:hypothetical protein [Nocardia sp. NPDC019255]|uniref:hypothetical protein n=1 Tax=Nocardia sp. NPDC019255 TaxID=3154591 RepID=UPI0033DD193A
MIHTFGDICYGEGRAGVSSPTETPGATRSAPISDTHGHAVLLHGIRHWRNLDTGAAGMAVPTAGNQ